MSLHDVETEILGPMQGMFLPPRNMAEEQQKVVLRSYGEVLSEFGRDDLKAAWRAVVQSHMTRAWPVPAQFVAAARTARKDARPIGAGGRFTKEKSYTEKRLLWERLRSGPLGLKAMQMGVAWSLKCAVLDDGKEEHEIDLPAMRRGKDSAERTAERIQLGEGHDWQGRTLPPIDGHNRVFALTMWDKIVARETETQREIRFHQKQPTQPAEQFA